MKPFMWFLSGLLCFFPSLTCAATEPTADEALARAIDALGGAEQLSQLHSWHAQGTIRVSNFEGTYEVWAQAPDRVKSIIDLEVVRVETGFDGQDGWERRGSGTSALSAEQLEQTKRSAQFLPLLTYHRDEIPVKLLGRRSVNGSDAWVLEFELPTGATEQHFIDCQSYFPIQEVRGSDADANNQITIRYDDYRSINGVKFPFSMVRSTSDRGIQILYTNLEANLDLPNGFFVSPAKQHEGEPFQVTLSTVPRQVFKENDGIFGNSSSENWLFHLLVDEKHGRALQAKSATLRFFSGTTLAETHQLDAVALTAIRRVSFTGLSALKEVFDLRFSFSRPVELAIDRMSVDLIVTTPTGEEIQVTHEFGLTNYQPKTELSFPLEGPFLALAAADFNEPHAQEWSQHHALDILALGPNLSLMTGDGSRNEDFATWGRKLLAPAEGKVTYARNDVPDNSQPLKVDQEAFASLPDRLWSIGGNCVVIDHGNGEFSFIAHMQKGSVQVKTGDPVKRGDFLGLLGNSGNSGAPHLHYHLMAGDTLFRSDPLPLRFNNVFMTGISKGQLKGPVKRGIYLESRW